MRWKLWHGKITPITLKCRIQLVSLKLWLNYYEIEFVKFGNLTPHPPFLTGLWTCEIWLTWMLWEVCADTVYLHYRWYQAPFGGRLYHLYLLHLHVFMFMFLSIFDLCPPCVYLCANMCTHFSPLQLGQTGSPPKDKCLKYTCVKSDNAFTLVSSHTVCPPFNMSNCQAVSFTFSESVLTVWKHDLKQSWCVLYVSP